MSGDPAGRVIVRRLMRESLAENAVALHAHE